MAESGAHPRGADTRIAPSLWIISTGASLVALPLLFFTDIATVGLGLLGLILIAVSADERVRLFVLVALIPFAHAGLGWSELGGFGLYDIFLGWFLLLYLWKAGPLMLFQVELPRPLWLACIMVLSFVPSIAGSGFSTESAKAFLQLCASILTAAGVYDILRRRDDSTLVRKLLIFFVGVAAVTSLYGLLQTVISGSIVSVAIGRAYFSLFQDVNYYSGYLLMALAVAIGMMFSTRHIITRLLFLGCIAVLTVGIIATFSRSALAVFVLLMATYMVYSVRQQGMQKWVGAAMIVGVAGLLGVIIFTDLGKKVIDLFTLSSRVETVLAGRDASLEQRANILAVTTQMIESNPIIGVGFGSFEETFERYKNTYLSTGFKRSAHNTYLRVAAETGVIGFSAYFLFLWSLMITVWCKARSVLGTPEGTVRLAVVFSLGTFLLMSATLDQMFEPHFWVIAGAALASGSVLGKRATHQGSQSDVSHQ